MATSTRAAHGRQWAISFAAIACVWNSVSCDSGSSGSGPPVKEIEWQRVEVKECGFSVEMPPGQVQYLEERLPEFPGFVTYFYTVERPARDGYARALCDQLPADLDVPNEKLLRGQVNRMEVSSAGLGHIETDFQFLPDSEDPAATFRMKIRNRKTGLWYLEGRLTRLGNQVHEVSAMHRNTDKQRADLTRMIRSYRRDSP